MQLTFAEKSIQTGATCFTPLLKWESFEAKDATILYQPGVYGGDGSENRVNICISSEDSSQKLTAYEACLVGNKCSCIKENHIKAKLSWDKVRFWDLTNERAEKPTKLAGSRVNLVFCIKGKWSSMGQNGLVLEVTDIQVIEVRETETVSPFSNPRCAFII